MNGFWAIIARDVQIGFSSGGLALLTAIFFTLIVVIFTFAIGPEANLMSQVAAAVLWSAALLATLVSVEQIFRSDYEDGSLDGLVEISETLELTVLAKSIAHWLTSCLPLILLTPVLALMLNMPSAQLPMMIVSLVVGTPALSLLATLSAALTVTLPRANMLVTILCVPLFVPVLIFGVGAATAQTIDSQAIYLSAANMLVCLLVAPIGAAAAIRANLS